MFERQKTELPSKKCPKASLLYRYSRVLLAGGGSIDIAQNPNFFLAFTLIQLLNDHRYAKSSLTKFVHNLIAH
jgi:hypothetical protein